MKFIEMFFHCKNKHIHPQTISSALNKVKEAPLSPLFVPDVQVTSKIYVIQQWNISIYVTIKQII